jgi:hypothetical protein
MPDSEYFCRYCGTRLGRVRINDYGAHSCPNQECKEVRDPTARRSKETTTVNRILVCFSHGRLFHPFDHTWIKLPDCLQDWAEDQTGGHWLFTAALCDLCPEAHHGEEETPRRH